MDVFDAYHAAVKAASARPGGDEKAFCFRPFFSGLCRFLSGLTLFSSVFSLLCSASVRGRQAGGG